jgi:t-SNARE complex subunit (syntaxin)
MGKMTLIEMLRANGSWEADAAVTAIQVRDNRIEKLETALREVAKINNQRDRFSADIDTIIVNALGEGK